MKKGRNLIFRCYNSILIFLLGVLGYSCDKDNGSDNPVCLYGVPYAKYTVQGKVTSEANSQPIPGIKVGMGAASASTANDGSYSITIDKAEVENPVYSIAFEDVDGAANGEFTSSNLTADFKNAAFTPGGNAWERKATIEMNVKLKPKK
jgi:putative lipoprotein (rSAM/lipoprotein system)